MTFTWISQSSYGKVSLELWERLGLLQICRSGENIQKYNASDFKALDRALYITSEVKAGPSLLSLMWTVSANEKLEFVPHLQ